MASPDDHVLEKTPFNAADSADSTSAPDSKASENPADTSTEAEAAPEQQFPGPFKFALVTFSLCLIIFVITLVSIFIHPHPTYIYFLYTSHKLTIHSLYLGQHRPGNSSPRDFRPVQFHQRHWLVQ